MKRMALSRFATSLLLAALLSPLATLSQAADGAAARMEMIKKLAMLSGTNDPASMEKTIAGYWIDACKASNPSAPEKTWAKVRLEINATLDRSITPEHALQVQIMQRLIENAHLTNDELQHLIDLHQDPVMVKFGQSTRSADSVQAVNRLAAQAHVDLGKIVAPIFRANGLTFITPMPVSGQPERTRSQP